MSEWTTTIPLPHRLLSPNNTRDAKNEWARRRINGMIRDQIQIIAQSWRNKEHVPKATDHRWIKILYLVPSSGLRHAMDDDNLRAACKHVMDAIVRAGWARNDRREDVTVSYGQAASPDNHYAVKVSVSTEPLDY